MLKQSNFTNKNMSLQKKFLKTFLSFLLFAFILLLSNSCAKDVDLFEIISEEQLDEPIEEQENETDSDENSDNDADSNDNNDENPDSNDNNDENSDSGVGNNGQNINIIFDTDINNELDDQHALAYLLSNGDIFNLEALTVNATSTGGGIQNDVDEAKRILQLYNLQNDVTVHVGAQRNFSAISTNFDPNNFDGIGAVDAIIEGTNNVDATIVALGKLTNVALAILKDPTIVNRTRVVWLGSNYPNNGEYNLQSDVDAMNYVLDSDIPFEIVTVRLGTAENGSSNVNTTVTEINQIMPGLGPLATTPITGRDGGTFSRFGDYSVDLFNYIGKETRSLFDLVAIAIVKDPSWGMTNSIPAPIYQSNDWVERPTNTREITIWGDFDSTSILDDFFESIENYSLVE